MASCLRPFSPGIRLHAPLVLESVRLKNQVVCAHTDASNQLKLHIMRAFHFHAVIIYGQERIEYISL